MSSISLAAVADDDLLETAFAWLCQQRKEWPAQADVWDLRGRWPEAKAELQAELRAGQFRFGVLSKVTLPTGDEMDIWSARDALVLKASALVLGARLPYSPRCMHVKGHGGAKAAGRQVLAQLPRHRFVGALSPAVIGADSWWWWGDIARHTRNILHDLSGDRGAGRLLSI